MKTFSKPQVQNWIRTKCLVWCYTTRKKIDWLARPFVMFQRNTNEKSAHTHTYIQAALWQSIISNSENQTLPCLYKTWHTNCHTNEGIVSSGRHRNGYVHISKCSRKLKRKLFYGNANWVGETNNRTNSALQMKFMWIFQSEWVCSMHARAPLMDICRYVVSVTCSQCVCQDDKLNVSLEFVQ